MAQTLSDDPSAAQNKGDLGAREVSKFIPRFAEEVKKLKIGEVSPPFETSYGVHVAQLLGHTPATRHSFDDVKPALVEEAEVQYLRSVWAEYIERIQNDPKLFVDTKALDALRPKLPEIPKQPLPTPAASESVKAEAVK